MKFVALLILIDLVEAVVAVVAKLFWPAAAQPADADDPWAQRNDLRMASLENAPEAGHTEVDAAIAAQINGVD